ncbi:Coproporphyrinogen III oxidase [Flagelloscypha sp. PMI_526]|nr:Coproporphyrinogen III oxidase [Flagelloscypha sp. PMI_526]
MVLSTTASQPEMRPKAMRQRVEEYIVSLQDQIVASLETIDPSSPQFKRDSWSRPQGGRGQSCIFPPSSSGSPEASEAAMSPSSSILEKAGVNISVVHGTLPPKAIAQMRADHSTLPLPENVPGGLPFFAAGISLVIHPRNPHAPTVHMNLRYFEVTEPTSDDPNTEANVVAWWFGGGSDLTPSYLYEEDAQHFHSTIAQACASHGSSLYPTLKRWCDEYFYIPHRGEARGLGGIFFDDLNNHPHARLPSDGDVSLRPYAAEDIFMFIQTLGASFVPSYLPILERRYAIPYSAHNRRWQLIRRGRYVEFNLVYDRGTKFGLMAPGARIESILMTLPETVRWEYMTEMGEEGTEEGRLMDILRAPRDWALLS